MVVLVTSKNKEDPIKNEGARVVTSFPYYNPMGAICCHGVLILSGQKPNAANPLPH